MTPEAQRIAIAEACGWKIQPGAIEFYGKPVPYGINPQGHVRILPDYLGDLNAMHEAEGKLIGSHEGSYIAHLTRLLFKAYCQTQTYDFGLCHATAAQRAEALLRTLGLWKEGE